MKPSISLLFGVHNHQPVGNHPQVFQKANQDCYRPFIDTLYRYPEIKSTLHFSGSLIDWLLKNDPQLLEKIKQMVKRAQAEILTGGYFEPILPIIPERDRLGQINMLSEFIRDYFEQEPTGIWIGERVWAPDLIKTLTRLGIKYTLLDDFHFRYAGIKEETLPGYYVTEKEGKSLAIFPISKKLRYSIPFSSSPAKVLAYLKGLAGKEAGLAATIVDDGEKFGLWPGTHTWVYQKRWLEDFFQLLLKSKDWLKTETISEYMSQHKPLGLCNIPSASYEEMMEWSAGVFNNFFIKYPEANNLHKRMLYVSNKVDKSENQMAKKYLYMGQCNCPYWHGVFGGIYLAHLRHKAYKNLIQAQSLAEKRKESDWVEAQLLDFDQDGADELILKNPFLNIFLSPKLGAGIFELDYIPKGFNLVNVMTRRPEAYHKEIRARAKKTFLLRAKELRSIHSLLPNKEKGLENLLIYDSYRRLSLLDHFLPDGITLKDFKQARYKELGDFINAQYSLTQESNSQRKSLILQREGRVNYNGRQMPLRISKNLSLGARDRNFSCQYTLQNLSPEPLDVIFAVEFNISLESPAEPSKLRCKGVSQEKSFSLNEDVSERAISELSLQDAVSNVASVFFFDKRPNLWSHPLETVSASAEGFERNYQQSVILPYWPLRLEKAWQVKITVAVSR